MIESRKEALEEGLERSDLFSTLLKSSIAEDKGSLTDQELMGAFESHCRACAVVTRPPLTVGCRKHGSHHISFNKPRNNIL